MRSVLALALAVFAACGKSGSGGKPAPALELDTILQADRASVSGWPDLKGRTVVLEFWSTWCEPCVEEIPHLNGLVDKLQGKPIVFISVSDEPREKVEAFLKEHPMKGWVAADAGAAFASFGIRARPHTVVVDGAGRLLGSTYPGFLNVQDLEQAMAGKPLARSLAAEDAGIAPAAVSSAGALFEARVAKAAGGKMTMSYSEDYFHGRSLAADWLLAQAFGVNKGRVVLEPPQSGDFDADIVVPSGSGDRLLPVFQLAAQTALGRALRRRTRQAEAYALVKAPAGAKLTALPPGSRKRGSSTGPGRITGQAMSLAEFREALEDALDTPVVDETGLKGRYDVALTWDYQTPHALETALETQLGLRAIKAKRPVELLVFEKAAEK